jgi:hypothetical protein
MCYRKIRTYTARASRSARPTTAGPSESLRRSVHDRCPVGRAVVHRRSTTVHRTGERRGPKSLGGNLDWPCRKARGRVQRRQAPMTDSPGLHVRGSHGSHPYIRDPNVVLLLHRQERGDNPVAFATARVRAKQLWCQTPAVRSKLSGRARSTSGPESEGWGPWGQMRSKSTSPNSLKVRATCLQVIDLTTLTRQRSGVRVATGPPRLSNASRTLASKTRCRRIQMRSTVPVLVAIGPRHRPAPSL